MLLSRVFTSAFFRGADILVFSGNYASKKRTVKGGKFPWTRPI
jgi:hypothetical protein